MFYWIAVDEDYVPYSVVGYNSYYDAECAVAEFLDNTSLHIMSWYVKEV